MLLKFNREKKKAENRDKNVGGFKLLTFRCKKNSSSLFLSHLRVISHCFHRTAPEFRESYNEKVEMKTRRGDVLTKKKLQFFFHGVSLHQN